jgi:hypothetical protein
VADVPLGTRLTVQLHGQIHKNVIVTNPRLKVRWLRPSENNTFVPCGNPYRVSCQHLKKHNPDLVENPDGSFSKAQ